MKKLQREKTLYLIPEEWVHIHQATEEGCCWEKGRPLPSIQDTENKEEWDKVKMFHRYYTENWWRRKRCPSRPTPWGAHGLSTPLCINRSWTEWLNTWPRVRVAKPLSLPETQSRSVMLLFLKCTETTPPQELLSDPSPKQVLISWLPMDQGEGHRKQPQDQHLRLFLKRRSLGSIVQGIWAPRKHNSGETEANVHIHSIQFPRINYG